MIWLGYYGGGSPTGPCWRRVEGGSWLIGTDGGGGGDSTYLYPDLATALVGRWRNGQMISAYPARYRSKGFGDFLILAFKCCFLSLHFLFSSNKHNF